MFRNIPTHLLAVSSLSFLLANASWADTLRVDEQSCYSGDHGYHMVSGTVTNVGNSTLDKVTAVVVYEDSQGRVIDRTSIAVNVLRPLAPGQSGSFEGATENDPDIERCKFVFKAFGGSPIPVAQDEGMIQSIIEYFGG